MQNMNIKPDPEGFEMVSSIKLENQQSVPTQTARIEDASQPRWPSSTCAGQPPDNWRSELKDCKLVTEQLLKMQQKRIYVDCTIIYGNNQRIKCHKVYLVRISPLMEQKLKDSAEVHVNCDQDTCEALIKYAYTDLLQLKGIETAKSLFQVAKHWGCDHLQTECLSKYQNFLSNENVMYHFDKLNVVEEDDFAQQCLEFIKDNADRVLECSPFMYIENGLTRLLSKCKVRQILSEDNMNISSELKLLLPLELWAERLVSQACKAVTTETIKAAVDNLLPKIRMLTLSEEELKKLSTRFFTAEEMKILINCVKTKDKSKLPDKLSKIDFPRGTVKCTVKQMFSITQEAAQCSPDSQAMKTPDQSVSASTSQNLTNLSSTSATKRRNMSSSSEHERKRNRQESGESLKSPVLPSTSFQLVKKESDFENQQRRLSQDSHGSRIVPRTLREDEETADCALFVRDAENNNNTKIFLVHRAVLVRVGGHWRELLYKPQTGQYIRDISKLPPLPLTEIISIPIKIFEIILTFLYDNILLCDAKDLYRVFSSAKDLKMTAIMKKCAAYLAKSQPTPTMVWRALHISDLTGDKNLEYQCMEVIKSCPSKCFAAPPEELQKIPSKVVNTICDLKVIDVKSEADIADFVERWAYAWLTLPGEEATPNIIRSFLESKNMISKIRFLSLTQEAFELRLSKTSLLSEEGKHAVYAILSGNQGGMHSKEIPPYLCQERKERFKTYHVGSAKHRNFDVPKEKMKTTNLNVNKDDPASASIQIKANKEIVLYGFTIPSQILPEGTTATEYEEDISVSVWCFEPYEKRHNMTRILLQEFKPTTKYNDTIKIQFPKNMVLKSRREVERKYVLKVKLKQSGQYKFQNIKNCTIRPIKRTFMDINFEINDFDDGWGNSGIFSSLQVSKKLAPSPQKK